jgi:hypothetical protein
MRSDESLDAEKGHASTRPAFVVFLLAEAVALVVYMSVSRSM